MSENRLYTLHATRAREEVFSSENTLTNNILLRGMKQFFFFMSRPRSLMAVANVTLTIYGATLTYT